MHADDRKTWSRLELDARGSCKVDMPKCGDFNNLKRWDARTRNVAIVGDLLQEISYKTDGEIVSLLYGGFGVTKSLVDFHRPSREAFMNQMPIVFSRAKQRESRIVEILDQLTPPYAQWARIAGLDIERTKFTYELIDVALQFALIVTQKIKHELCVSRPYEYSTYVQPIIQTPGHGALPSGHSTEAHLIALLLGSLTPHTFVKEQLMQFAKRVADNRVVAGVHFPVDSAAGLVLAHTIFDYLKGRAAAILRNGADGKPQEAFIYGNTREFKISDQEAKSDFNQIGWDARLKDKGDENVDLNESSCLKWLWQLAYSELN
jgi:hypothetical protein